MPPKKQTQQPKQESTKNNNTPREKLIKTTKIDQSPLQPTTYTPLENKFSTTSSGLIQYNFDSDSENEDIAAPIPTNLQEDLTSFQEEQRSKTRNQQSGFFEQLAQIEDSDDEAVIKETVKSRRAKQVNNAINSYANLIKKRSLAAKSQLNVVNLNQSQSTLDNETKELYEDIKAKLVKKHRQERYDIGDYDSDDSDFAEDLLPVLSSDDEEEIDTKAKQLALKEIKSKRPTPTMNDGDDDQHLLRGLTPEEIASYKLAAEALESDSDDDFRYGDSGDEEDEEEKTQLEEKLNKDIFETQTSAFTTDEAGVLVQVNHNISFADMYLSKPTIIALEKNGFVKPTPIQAASVPIALKGFDIMANAVTGSGKTVAFLLPIIERLTRMPQRSRCIRAIIITPTRELAEQIFGVAVNLTRHGSANISLSCIFGGVSMAIQENELRQGPDIVICTPGRMIDHLTNTMGVSIDRTEVLVLDEADRLLDLGFRDEVQHIIDLSSTHRQTLLFSATVNSDVEDLIKKSLRGYKRVFVDKASSIVTTLSQQFIRLRHDNEILRQAIVLSLCKREFKHKTIIFVKMKSQAQSLNILFKLCGLLSGELHGDLSQAQRSEVLESFRKQKLDFLIATDIAARGLDIKGILTVINMHLPVNYNSYVHRVGRTARAGEKGTAISLVAEFDRKLLRDMMKVHDVEQDENVLNAKDEKSKTSKGKSNNNLLLHLKKREIAGDILTKYTKKVQVLQPHVEKLIQEIKDAKSLDIAERDITRAENLIKHENEIKERPKKEWFQTTYEKKEVKEKTKTIFQELGQLEKDKRALKEMSADLQKMQAEEKALTEKKKKKKDDLRGLSRTEKRRKLFQIEQGKYAEELRHEIATDKTLTDKQRLQKHHEITSILKPEITASYVKRSARRDKKDQVQLQKLDNDGAGPAAFEQYAKQYEKLKHISNPRKRKLAEEQLTSTSGFTKNRRYQETSDAHDSMRKRYAESRTSFDRKQTGLENERREQHKVKRSGFKSQSRYKRR